MHFKRFILASSLCAAAPYTVHAAPAKDGAHHAHHAETAQQASPQSALQSAIAASTRTPANIGRDTYRHPEQTLSFFGIRPDMTVVEIWPGGGWYTEILAPYLAAHGTYYAAAPTGKYGETITAKLATDPATYGKVRLTRFPATEGAAAVPDGSADLVLTFRNAHNWIMAGDDVAAQAFRDMYKMLKPGGVLGVVDHRLPENADDARQKGSGYVKTSAIRRYAEQAGFKLVAESEINANPLDTKDYANGVWTLPPVLRSGDQDRARYLAIGESDRMTLRFIKPGK